MRFYLRLNIAEIKELEFSELDFYARMLDKHKFESYKKDMVSASFTAWQNLQAQGAEMSWDRYISLLGFGEKKIKINEDVKKMVTDKALAIAEKIKAASKK